MRKKIYREDIVAAGMELMLHIGYYATGIKDITDKLGIPKGSFYNHFKSKEQFGLTVLESYTVALLADLDLLFANHTLPPLQRIRVFMDDIIEQQNKQFKYQGGCLLGNFSQELADMDETFRREIQQSFGKLQQKFSACLQEAKNAGQLRIKSNSAELADFIINGWEGAYLRMKAEQNTRPIEQFRDTLFDVVLR